jgi:HEPN domain-containing protein
LQYWLSYAQNDLDTAEAMFNTGRWFYVFITCQQALEKLVKGLYILYVDDNVPRTHDISLLLRKFENKLNEPVREGYYEFCDNLKNFYLRSRYPDYARALVAQADKNAATVVYVKIKEAYQWLLTMKKQKSSSANTSQT